MKYALSTWKITLFVSLFITIFGNYSFWENLNSRAHFIEEPFLSISFFVIIISLSNLLLTLVSFKPIFKIVIIAILLTSAFASYFMDNYSVMVDKGMIRNIFATNLHETKELLSFRLLITIILLGVIPSWLIIKAKIHYQPILKGLFVKLGVTFVCLTIISTTLYSNYQELSFFGRNNRELRHLINPMNYIFSLKSIIATSIKEGEIIVAPIENDATKKLPANETRKPSLVILVLGETARSMNFSLNGYHRETNPLLAKKDIINFSDVTSCGTATAVSVPCMFSKFSRTDFSNSKAKKHENVLDVISHAGYEVLWRDNNTGCQGTCKGISYEDLANEDLPEYCQDGNCIDEILLNNLHNIVTKDNGDKLIILHQKGNHGPTYHLRYPKRFEVFKPACKTNQLRSCSKEEIVNAYDNALLYSDFFISKSIDFLKNQSTNFNTALVYISDHGESLGENNLYLHGLPYMIAPDQQKKVPFILWLSNEYQHTFNINPSCMMNKAKQKLSHDNLFSSMLGLLAIETEIYDKNLDIFSSCNNSQLVKNDIN